MSAHHGPTTLDATTAHPSPDIRVGHIVVLDWSAAARPTLGADSIWWSWLDTATGDIELVNCATRHHATTVLGERLRAVASDEPVLMTIDASLGYPAGFAARTGLVDRVAPWRATWQFIAASIVDHQHGGSRKATADTDRFGVAAALNRRMGTLQFWGTPPSRSSAWLTTTRPTSHASSATHGPDDPARPLPTFRIVEQRLRAEGHRPFSAWQLLGAGSVGSQTFTAVAALDRLRAALTPRLVVWPFDTGCTLPPALTTTHARGSAATATGTIVVAEAWPSMLPSAVVDAEEHRVKDARQVMALARHLAGELAAGRLGAWFTPTLDDDERRAVEGEEGWVLGVR